MLTVSDKKYLQSVSVSALLQIIIIDNNNNMPTKYPLSPAQPDQDLSICLNNNSPVNKWCTFEVLDFGTMIVESAYLGCLLLLLLLMLKRFTRIVRNRNSLAEDNEDKQSVYGNLFVRIYLIMFGWLAASIVRVSLCLVVYHKYMAVDFQQHQQQYQHQSIGLRQNGQSGLDISDMIVALSNVYTFLNFLCVFLVNWLIIMISHSWLYIVLQSTKQTQSSLSISRRRTIHIFFSILKIMQVYYRYLRVCFIALLLVQPLLFYLRVGHCQFSDINCNFVIAECSIVIAFYGFGLGVFYFMIRNKLMNVRDRDMQKLRIEYFALMLTLMCRLVYNLFPITNNPNYHPNANYSNTDPRQSLQLTLILSIHHVFMHLLPIVIVLYIYRINFTVGPASDETVSTMIATDKLQDSLIVSSTQNKRKNKANYSNNKFGKYASYSSLGNTQENSQYSVAQRR